MKRVAITGIGVVTPLGNTAAELFANLIAGRSGIRHLDDDFGGRITRLVAAPTTFDGARYFAAPKLRMLDRSSQFALVATQQALSDARLGPLSEIEKSRTGVFLGTSMGGSQSSDQAYRTLYAKQSDRINPFSVLLSMNNAATAWISLEYGYTGCSLTFSTACSSSAVAIGEAARRIRSGEMDTMVAGGTEAPLSLGPLKAWEALRTLATVDPIDPAASCKPFSKDRSGLVLGEGAAILILEEWEKALARDATIHGELIGYGLATDAGHLTRPSVAGQARAMHLALDSAAISPAAIDYLNAHGSGTPANDAVETSAIKEVFGDHAYRLPVSSTKSMHGHLLGAAGALEFTIALMAMKSGTLPPTINLHSPDPDCDLDYVANTARYGGSIAAVMSNSFAFGGANAVLIARRR